MRMYFHLNLIVFQLGIHCFQHGIHCFFFVFQKHSAAMYMYKMAPPRIEPPLFPSNCVESTQPKYIKRRKYTHKEIGKLLTIEINNLF